jgi:TLD
MVVPSPLLKQGDTHHGQQHQQRKMQRRKSDSLAVSPSAAMVSGSSNNTPPLLPPLHQLPPSSLRRLMSDGSNGRKSVTFGDLPSTVAARQLHTLVDESEDGDTSSSVGKEEQQVASSSASASLKQDDQQQLQQQEPPPVAPRSDSPSQSSIPSLHLAHPLRSFSILSNNSIPSLHLAHPIRSNSMDSRPSIHLAHPIRSNSTDSRSAGLGGAAAADAAAAAFSFDGSFDDRDPSETAGSRFEEKKTESSSDDVMLNTWLEGNNNNHAFSSIPTRVVVQQDGTTTSTAPTTDQQQPQQPQIVTTQPLHDDQRVVQQRALVIREASSNAYRGEGMEIAEFDDDYHLPQAATESSQQQPASRPVQSSLQAFIQNPLSSNVNIVDIGNTNGFLQQSRPVFGSESLLSSFGGAESTSRSIYLTNSFDETMSVDCSSRRRRNADIFRQSMQNISRSLSDDDVTGVFLGGSRYYNFRETSTDKECRIPGNENDDDYDDASSWRMGDDDDEDLDYYDPWLVIEDEYENGYGGGGTLPFRILGTSGNDLDARPHVMSPPLMESLQAFLPYSKAGENFWMKFSMVRDGASMSSLLRHARGSKYTFLAIETTDGEVFGSFTSAPWRKNWNYFGGQDSFLWRMRHTRKEKSHSIIDQAKIESEIDVFHCTGENYNIQLCTHDRIAVGGGAGESEGFPPNETTDLVEKSPSHIKQHEWGFGLTIDDDLLQGTSSPCLTFGSPSLSNEHADGSRFEIINLELWTLTPCQKLQDAEKLELGLLFLDSHKTSSGNIAYNFPGSKDDDDDDEDYELSASPLSPSGYSAASNLAVTSPNSQFSR